MPVTIYVLLLPACSFIMGLIRLLRRALRSEATHHRQLLALDHAPQPDPPQRRRQPASAIPRPPALFQGFLS